MFYIWCCWRSKLAIHTGVMWYERASKHVKFSFRTTAAFIQLTHNSRVASDVLLVFLTSSSLTFDTLLARQCLCDLLFPVPPGRWQLAAGNCHVAQATIEYLHNKASNAMSQPMYKNPLPPHLLVDQTPHHQRLERNGPHARNRLIPSGSNRPYSMPPNPIHPPPLPQTLPSFPYQSHLRQLPLHAQMQQNLQVLLPHREVLACRL
jgi:hypothetical protein